MRRRFCEGEGDDSAGCPPGPAIGILVGEPTEPERTAEQSQVLTQEMEIVLNPCALSQQYPSAIAGSSWGSEVFGRVFHPILEARLKTSRPSYSGEMAVTLRNLR